MAAAWIGIYITPPAMRLPAKRIDPGAAQKSPGSSTRRVRSVAVGGNDDVDGNVGALDSLSSVELP